MKRLRFFTGCAGDGHKDALYAAAIEAMHAGSEVIFIVPEQATFLAEQRLSRETGGLIGLQVLSFQRLAERVLDETGRRKPYLKEQGVAMVARRAAEKHGEELKLYGRAVKQAGFCTELSGLFGELKRAMITPEELLEKIPGIRGSSLTREKLTDVALLYRETENWIAGKYMTEDDGVNAAIRLIPQSFAAGVVLFIDFDGLSTGTRQFENLFSALLAASKEVTCAITTDPMAADEPLFAPAEELKARLSELGASLGLTVTEKAFPKREEKPAVLAYVADTLFRRPGPDLAAYLEKRKKGAPDTEPLEIHAFSNCAEEAEGVADMILDFAKKGIRYRDMAVLVSDADTYEKLIRRSFALRGIPLFADEKRGFASFSAVDTLVAALRCASGSFRTKDMLRLAKSGFAGVDASGAEALENYCLRYGIRGSAFTAPFTLGRKSESDTEGLSERDAKKMRREQARIDEAENARAILTGPLSELKEGLHARTAGEKLAAVYRYLEKIGLPRRLTEISAELIEKGETRRAQEHGAIWRLLTETLDQLHLILGDIEMSREDFLSVMEEGLSGEVVRVVPDTADRVLVGDVIHTVPGENVRVLFVLGAGEGMLPKDRHDDGLLSNSELALLKACGLSVGTGTDRHMALDRYAIYLALAAASEKLIFTHSMTVDGHESLMSGFLERIQKNTGVNTVLHNGARPDPVSERMGFRLLAELLRDEPEEPGTQALLAYYKTRPEYAEHARRMNSLSSGLPMPERIATHLSRRLFREGQSMSASRLEQFSGCPFRHFMNYGLGAEVRPEAQLKVTDRGTFYHAIVERFVKTVMERGLDYRALRDDEETIDAIVEEIVPGILDEGDGTLKTDARLAAQIPLFVENAKYTVRAIVRQIAAGSFRPVGAEVCFERNGLFPEITLDLGDGRKAVLKGVIDRVDAAPGPDGKRLFRVVDYKTTGRNMDYAKIEAGIHVQLPLYLYAIGNTAEPSDPAGMYYMQIQPKAVNESGDAEKDKKGILEQLRMKGITVWSEESIRAAGEDSQEREAAISSARVKQDGSPNGADSFCSERQMRLFMRHVKRIAEAKAKAMFDGEIAIAPASGACDYCDYRSVCGFDPKMGCRVRKLGSLKREGFLANLEKEEERS